jgi:hypothetical protein
MDGANPIHYIASQSIEHSTHIHNTMFITHTPHHHAPTMTSHRSVAILRRASMRTHAPEIGFTREHVFQVLAAQGVSDMGDT